MGVAAELLRDKIKITNEKIMKIEAKMKLPMNIENRIKTK
jgi:hypothetical protein